jgi:hypothetical protein
VSGRAGQEPLALGRVDARDRAREQLQGDAERERLLELGRAGAQGP